jgi:outer membrane protein assembly factor BamB
MASCSGCRGGPQPLACPAGTSEHANPPPDKLERWCAKDDGSLERNGPYERYWPSGKLREQGSFEAGARSGQWVVYDETGKVRTRTGYQAGRRSGMAQRLDDRGEVVTSGEYQDGKRDGEWTFLLGGKSAPGLRAKVRYVGGLADTPLFIENAEGESVPPEAFALGLRDGDLKLPDAKGNTLIQGQVQDGRRQGMFTVFHPSGKPASRAGYRNGRLDGPFATWDAEGGAIAEGSFDSGSLESVFTDRFNPVSKNLRLLTTLPAPLAADPLRLSTLLVVATKDSKLMALQPQTGAVVWTKPVGPAVAYGPMASGGSCPIAVVTTDKRLRLLNAETGDTCSEIALDTDVRPALVSGRSDKGIKLVAVGAAGQQVTAVDARDGQEIWKYEAEAPITAGPLVIEGEWAEGRRAVVGDAEGRLIWLDLGTGKKELERTPAEELPGPVVELVAGGDLVHVIRQVRQGFALEPYTVTGRREAGYHLDERPKVASAGLLTVFVSPGQIVTYQATNTGPSVSQKALPPEVQFQNVFAHESSAYLIASRPATLLRLDVGRPEWGAASRLPRAVQCSGRRFEVVDRQEGVVYLGCESSRSVLALSLPLQGSTEAWKLPDRTVGQCLETDGIVVMRPVDAAKGKTQGVAAVDALSGVTLWEAVASHPSPSEDFLAAVGPVVIFDQDGRLTARSRVNGRVVWEHVLEDQIIDGECVSSNAPAMPFTLPQPYSEAQPQGSRLAKPVVLGATVYVSTSCGVGAIDALTGVLEWIVPSPTPYLTLKLSPTSQGSIVAGNDKGIWALDPSTGKVLWTTSSGNSFAVTDQTVITSLEDARLVAYDALTGGVSWLYRPPSRDVDGNSPRLAMSNQGTVQYRYVARTETGEMPYLVMINPNDGAVLASYDSGLTPASDGLLRQPAKVSQSVCGGPLNQYVNAGGFTAERTVPFQ